jgi:hypothetical protein
VIPNNERSYKNIGELISNARLAGLIDWYAIEDRTRYIRRRSVWETPGDIIAASASQYHIDLWADQPSYVEVWCFLPGTPVTTDKGIIPIENVGIDDNVLTSNGTFSAVSAPKAHRHEGMVYTIKGAGLEPVTVTGNHRFMVYVAGPGKGAKRKYSEEPVWVRADEIGKFDLLIVPRAVSSAIDTVIPAMPETSRSKRPATIDVGIDFYRVIGLFLAEGCVRGDGRTAQFTIGDKSSELVELITAWAQRSGISTSTAAGRGCTQVYLYNASLARWLAKWFGNGAFNKYLPTWIIQGRREHIAEVVKYYILGDGCLNDETRNAITVSSRSRNLLRVVHKILLDLGYAAAIYSVEDHGKPTYRVSVSGKSAIELAYDFGFSSAAVADAGVAFNHMRVEKDRILVPVREVVPSIYKGMVYNFEVEETHDYCVPFVTHNCEKDALIGVVEQVARRHDVPCFSCRGYTSQTEMWNAAQRLIDKSNGCSRPVTVIHLGDHDPSGIDMTRDIEERLVEFSHGELGLTIDRIALNMDQIEEYSPPPNPAKITDSRADAYIKMFGGASWELDALNPKILDSLIDGKIAQIVDQDLMGKAIEREAEEKATLRHAEEFVRKPHLWQRVPVVVNDYSKQLGLFDDTQRGKV